jgi:hypothetical protein
MDLVPGYVSPLSLSSKNGRLVQAQDGDSQSLADFDRDGKMEVADLISC